MFASEDDMSTERHDSKNDSSEADNDEQSCDEIELIVFLRKETQDLRPRA